MCQQHPLYLVLQAACLSLTSLSPRVIGTLALNVIEYGGCWKTFRSRDEALIIGICALLDPKQLPGPLPCEGTRHVSMIGDLSLSSISALPVSRAVSKDIFGDEPTCVPHYGGSNGRRQLASTSAPKRPAQTCKLFANDPTRLA